MTTFCDTRSSPRATWNECPLSLTLHSRYFSGNHASSRKETEFGMLLVERIPTVYPLSFIERIRAALAAGGSLRAVAAKLNCSRSLVGRVARGDPSVLDRRQQDVIGLQLLDEPVRCPRCGVLVTTCPCRRCYTKAVAAIVTRPALVDLPEPELVPDLESPAEDANGNPPSYLEATAFLEPETGPIVSGDGARAPSPDQIRRRCAAIQRTRDAGFAIAESSEALPGERSRSCE